MDAVERNQELADLPADHRTITLKWVLKLRLVARPRASSSESTLMMRREGRRCHWPSPTRASSPASCSRLAFVTGIKATEADARDPTPRHVKATVGVLRHQDST
ncbi:hypothetical protein GUJ93_ZPchr0002g25402 [Zizania palustris]|uniref:Uncharacterized protein n=1 Tax=Zizania palustris TaxID=103762 RepID=A0A8J5SPI1_ZIZPA|nr:hypothetical protein GUJ93_ZPchr0002g25402 [Zizania palustris]